MQDDDLIFETMLHQKEIEKTLKSISIDFSERDSQEITSTLINHTKAIEKFADAIQELPSPEVNIELNQDKVIESIEDLSSKILINQKILINLVELHTVEQITTNDILLKVLNELIKHKEWEFNFKKDAKGNIISSTATQIK